jgi:glucose/arabinose dehydrogenase
MPPGTHVLELAAFIVAAVVLESPRSAPLQVNKTAGAAAPVPGPAADSPVSMIVHTSDGLQMRLDWIARDLVKPVDMAFAPDGRLFIAEESGRVRVLLPNDRLLAEPALSLDSGTGETRLLALAVDSRFDQTRFVYVIYAAPDRGAGALFNLARLQESSNALFGQVVLLDGIPAPATGASAALRVDADGRVFAALDDGGDPSRAGDLASPNGKLLRLDPDGTTPDDQAGFTPMYAAPFHSPRGFGWQPGSNLLWIADQTSEASAVIEAIGASPGSGRRGEKRASYRLPRGTRPSSIAFYRGQLMPALQDNLLIASDEGRHLLRLRFDPADPTAVIGTERLLQNVIGGLRAVAAGPNGKIYIATSDAIATLTTADQ